MINKVIIMGRLTADPELKNTQSGIAVIRFTVAVNRQYKKDQEQQADFIRCTAWRQSAEFISKYFAKGKMIIVEGALRNNDYTDANGVKHHSMDVQVDNVSFGESKGGGQAQNSTQPSVSPVITPEVIQNATPASEAIPDLSGFEEILSDGDVPF
jgi:single-strand DNA-binding protein|nr:MAG TPA: Single strand binding protein [Caudoviricetes sp.]